MQIDEPFVEDDASARLAVAEGEDPDPEAIAGVVIRGQPPRADVARREPAPRREVVDVPHVLPAAPDRRGGMLVVAVNEIQAPAKEIHATCCVDDPAAGNLARFIADLE